MTISNGFYENSIATSKEILDGINISSYRVFCGGLDNYHNTINKVTEVTRKGDFVVFSSEPVNSSNPGLTIEELSNALAEVPESKLFVGSYPVLYAVTVNGFYVIRYSSFITIL